ncbi:MAG: PEGA domain-containing protein [Chitinivibrionales bacterium]|nr:PEGA domain-containing protein [Chitinivibrionales bacterium]
MLHRLIAIVLLLGTTICRAAPVANGNFLDNLVIFQFTNATDDVRFNNFHLLLKKRFEYKVLILNIRAEAWNTTYQEFLTQKGFRPYLNKYELHGAFSLDRQSNEYVLKFTIVDNPNETESIKKVPLAGKTVDDLVEIVVLKTDNYLSRTILGKLNVTSFPTDCEIFLNGVNTGLTPKEFSLESGTYKVQITGEFLKPFERAVEIVPGRTIDLDVQMSFKGYPTVYWMIGAFAFTSMAIVSNVIENEYKNNSLADSDKADTAEAIRLSFQHLAVIGWTGTAFCFYMNRSIEQKIFKRK